MDATRPFAHALSRIQSAGLRPTRQRLALAKLLFDNGDRHLTAETLHGEALAAKVRVSLATVYNTLHQFTEMGLLREVVVKPGKSYCDTNTSDHHHFIFEDGGEIEDFPGAYVKLQKLPEAPAGTTVDRIDVIIRVRKIAN